MGWIFLLITMVAWGAYDLFFKGLEGHLNYFLALFVIGLSQVCIAIPFVVYYYLNHDLQYSSKGLALAASMGALLGLGTIFFFYAFKAGASASIAIPAYSVGVLLIGVVGGMLLFGEQLNLKAIFGIAMGIGSILLLATSK